MNEPTIRNAVISSAEITSGDRGFLDCWLSLDYGDSGQGFGGYVLYLPGSFAHHELKSFAGHHIFRCMQVADVTKWAQMKGRTVRVKCTSSSVAAIGHIVKDDWYCPEDDFGKAKSDDRR